MLSLPLPVRIYLCTRPVDLRKSFDGLAQLVREFLGADPLSGHLFVFHSKRRDRLKLLHWDRDGYWILYKRLELGTFRFPAATGSCRRPPGFRASRAISAIYSKRSSRSIWAICGPTWPATIAPRSRRPGSTKCISRGWGLRNRGKPCTIASTAPPC